MAKINLPYTYLAKGKYWRFRHRKTGDVGIKGQHGEPLFHARYKELMDRVNAISPLIDRQSLSWLFGKFLHSAEYLALADDTQKDYATTIEFLKPDIGEQPFLFITRKMVKVVRDKYAKTPRKAHKVKQMISRVYSWADECDLVPEGMNPAAKIKKLKSRAKIIAPWTEDDIAIFSKNCPPHILTPLLLTLFTGQRRADITSMDWEQYQPNNIRVRQSKTGELMDLPPHPVLKAHLDSIKHEFGGRIARTEAGKPYTVSSLSQTIRRRVQSLDMPNDRSMHGLRYAAAGRMEEGGATPGQCSSVLGHRTYQMAMKYLLARRSSKTAVEMMQRK